MGRLLRVLFMTIVLLLLGYAGLHYWIKSKVKHQLSEKLPKSWVLDYGSMSLNLLKGNVDLKDVSLHLRDSLAYNSFMDIETKRFGIYGLSYAELVEENEISITQCTILEPRIIYKPYAHQHDSLQKRTPKKKYQLHFENIDLERGQFVLLSKETNKEGLQIENFDLHIKNLFTKEKDSSRIATFESETFELALNDVSYAMAPYEKLKIAEGRMSNESVHLSQVSIVTTLSREELNKQLKKERDHYDLSIPEVRFDFPDLKKVDSLLFAHIPKMFIEQPHFKVYRDKLLPDDYSRKSLFNEKFRNLPFQLALDSLKISNADILYTEKDEYFNDGGSIEFIDMNIEGSRIGNAYRESDTTRITGHGLFMGNANLDFNWEFLVHDTKDSFDFKAEVEALNASDMNVLTRNNMDILLEGQVDDCSFHIRGNHYSSYQNFKIRYHNLNIRVLDKKKGKESWIGSKLANLIVKKNSYSKTGRYKFRSGTVRRDPTKSFFNYLWLNVKDGLIHTLL